ncbi:hypothetical protein SAMN02745194_04700 [Roseomonas rosea]|uniref:Phage integrase, N-terminal SAM-like domain n=1 Tax=Muricoccus roseus TaxID=198092 RepID=A0A1M6RII2_9PROT|nr:hypothetical protein SAMN02745194_04700 [Roseomonas rosea]
MRPGGVPSIAAVQPLHVATWIEIQTRERSAPTAKQSLAAVRHLSDWLVVDQVCR